VIVAAAKSTGWTAIVVAVLGSSAIGAIVGGFITTRLRGRIEHDEAWRTRMIDAADEFKQAIADALLAFKTGPLKSVVAGSPVARDAGGSLAPEGTNDLVTVEVDIMKAYRLLARIQLIFGGAEEVADKEAVHRGEAARSLDSLGPSGWALHTIDCLLASLRLFDARSVRAGSVIRAAVQQRGGGTPDALPADDREAFRVYAMLVAKGSLPTTFDLTEERSVAAWTLVLRDAAVDAYDGFVAACGRQIHEDHPGPIAAHPRGWRRFGSSVRR
jgi:hypothetical protein